MINIVGLYRKHYIKSRLDKKEQDLSHECALQHVYAQLLHASAEMQSPVSRKDLRLIDDLEKNPHYRQLLEDIVQLPEESQREYLRNVAQAPKLRLVK